MTAWQQRGLGSTAARALQAESATTSPLTPSALAFSPHPFAADEEFDQLCFEYGIELDDVVRVHQAAGTGD